MSLKDKKILVLTSCSAKKRDVNDSIEAQDLYQGDFFKKVLKFTLLNNFDFRIISAKYGLLSPHDSIKKYNRRLNFREIEELSNRVNPSLSRIIKYYDRIIILMGKNYRKIIEKSENKNFIEFFDKRGLGGYKSLMNYLLTLEDKFLYKLFFEQQENKFTLEKIQKLNIH